MRVINIKDFNFLKAVNLYMRILDAKSYIESCRTLENTENKNIMDFICEWLKIIEKSVRDNAISDYYGHPENINYHDIENISNELDLDYEALRKLFDNMKYIPIKPPFFILKTMVDEIYPTIQESMKISNIHFKNITDFNFTESKMIEPHFHKEGKDAILRKINQIPNVLSMTVNYHANPLMWPLIFHEYGHTAFKKIKLTNDYEQIFSKVRLHCSENKIPIESDKLSAIMSEVFSDLFAINYHISNYFFAFYFHEILGSDVDKLLNIVNGEFQIDDYYPPSAFRLKYMLKELDKKGYNEDNEALEQLLKYHRPFAEEITKKMDKIDPEKIELYELMSNELSNLFNDVKVEINQILINELYDNLKMKLPIGTSCNGDIKELLKLSQKEFDIDNNNRTIDMIYTGWKFLILDMIAQLCEVRDYKKYLEYSKIPDEKIKNKPIDNKIFKFIDAYNFLNKNISYSIETSMIVSNYKGI